MSKPITTAELQKIITRWDDGSGVTATVKAFAQAVPVAERTVWYWIGGRKIHRALAERIRGLLRHKSLLRSKWLLVIDLR
ncbi:MAG TPA: hypothetical protein VMG10_06930 [Gemmataceae bacterium]|nr:hypothetical protein [Gemmataceae bacterium]